jgi:hypothetical protein
MDPSPVGSPAIDLPLCRDTDVRHVGVVFVHGIGSQEQGEILRDWGGAIARVLIDFRVAAGANGDPVLATQLDPTAPGRIFVELQLPETTDAEGTTRPEEHWLLTEAWWAHEITPPTFGQMAQWLGPEGAVPRIVRTIIPHATGGVDPRALASSPEPAGSPLPDVSGPPPGERRDRALQARAKRAVTGWRKAPMANTRDWLVRAGAWAYLQAFSALLLLLYGALRSIETLIPIGPLANGALTRPIDRFVLEWFGDVFVLLGVPAQAASVRGRLAAAVADLQEAKAGTIVVIAHSGGAIVSWTTLADESTSDLRVDHLVTIGEGLNLGWNITSGDGTEPDIEAMLARARQRFERLYQPLMELRPDLRWTDYWGSRDPAPSGPLAPPDAALRPPAERSTSMPIWNLLSFREDHGAYWDNDEEFVIPLLRRLEDRPDDSSYFGDDIAHILRSNRRRRRISVLSVWRQLGLLAPMAAVITSFVAGTGLIPRIGDALAAAWAVVPGSQIVIAPLDAIRSLHLETVKPIDTLAEIGVWVVAALIAVAAGYALISPPERGTPWSTARTRPARLVGWLVRHGRLLTAIPVLVLVVTAAVRFWSGATSAGLSAVWESIPWILLGIAVVIGAFLASQRWLVVRIGATVIVLALGSYAVLAPIAAVLVFPQVGAMVLGTIGVVVGFGILVRIGTWRWTAWDLRERAAAHAREPVYQPIGLVASQCVVLLVSLALFFAAVSFALPVIAGIGVALTIVAVLVGIAIDVNHSATPGMAPGRTTFEGYQSQRKL